MVLVLNGVLQDDCPMDTNSLFLQHPVYRDYAQQLHSIQAKSIGPVGLLYVGQRELAAAAPHDKNINIIGADDATTCIIVVVRHSGESLVVNWLHLPHYILSTYYVLFFLQALVLWPWHISMAVASMKPSAQWCLGCRNWRWDIPKDASNCS